MSTFCSAAGIVLVTRALLMDDDDDLLLPSFAAERVLRCDVILMIFIRESQGFLGLKTG